MPLVTPLAIDSALKVAKLPEFFNETFGYCPNSLLTMMLRHPIATAFIKLNMAIMENKGLVTSVLKQLVVYITSQPIVSVTVKHTPFVQRNGMRLSRKKLENVWGYRTFSAFANAECVALDFALASSTIPNALDKQLQARL